MNLSFNGQLLGFLLCNWAGQTLRMQQKLIGIVPALSPAVQAFSAFIKKSTLEFVELGLQRCQPLLTFSLLGLKTVLDSTEFLDQQLILTLNEQRHFAQDFRVG